jgi:hypothetical protein
MTTTASKYSISRRDAAALLDVSTRTVDRYIRSKKLSSRKKGGTIMLSEEELSNLQVSKFQGMHGATPSGAGRVHRHVNSAAQTTIIDAETGEIEENLVKPKTKEIAKTDARDEVYEELYKLSRSEVREYHNKLESVNYRLGQLETQLTHSVPLLDFKVQTDELKEQEGVLENKLKRQGEALEMMEQELTGERLNKHIFIGMLFGLLALNTLLWLFLS